MSLLKSVFRKNVFFLFTNTLLIPTLALNSIQAFLNFAYNKNWEQWNQVIGSILLSSSGFFFLQYLIHVSILGTAGQMLDVGQNIWRWWKLRSAITEVEVENALKR